MSPEDYQEPDSPFAGGPADPAGAEPGAAGPAGEPGGEPGSEPGKSFNWYGLRNSDPPIRPGNIGDDLDLGAEWWEHLFTGFLKQSGADAAEAWQHYVISLILLVDQEHGILDDDGRDELEETADGWEQP